MASIATREPLTMPSRPAVWFAYLYLIIGVSVASYLLYLFALSRWSATATSYSFVMRPPVTVAIAAVVAAEPVGPRFMLGAGLVLAGALIGALLPRRR
jgi:drug/metabolite transporter (DMT)-like permease